MNKISKHFKNNIFNGIDDSWYCMFKKCIDTNDIENINTILQGNFYPRKDDIFNAFKHFKFNETKVVILGQDCYINMKNINGTIVPQANGLAFSVSPEHSIPPSLKNIFKEMSETLDDFTIPNNGDLSRWAKEENILLLNAALTVEPNKSNSHMKYWKDITDNIIEYISNNNSNVIFILWGNFAKSKEKLIDPNKHYIIKGIHPSPLSARYNMKGTDNSFFGHYYFNKVNKYLEKNNKELINWSL